MSELKKNIEQSIVQSYQKKYTKKDFFYRSTHSHIQRNLVFSLVRK